MQGGDLLGQYKDLVKDMTFSHSRLTCFEQCPYQFYLSYILRDFELYPRSDNFYGQLGGYVHEILEMIFNGELDVEDASQYYVDHYKEKVVAKEKKNIVQNAYEACADYLCSLHDIFLLFGNHLFFVVVNIIRPGCFTT